MTFMKKCLDRKNVKIKKNNKYIYYGWRKGKTKNNKGK